ncbi:hypothetical protein FRC10_000186 [Ceratobasidium sp. 414]|nr:hypothetical protein FRC10_000186 [Ceratobasidium sp. 414]
MLALQRDTHVPREERLQQEAEAKRQVPRPRSNEIDEQLRLESIALRKRKARERKILLLGQSESGKSTLLKQFQLLHSTGDVFDSERASWRLIIFHNLVRSIIGVLDEINLPLAPSTEYPDNDEFYRVNSTTFKTMRVRLSPLSQIADLIANKLSPEASSPVLSPTEPGSDWTSTANPAVPPSEISVLSSYGWKSALRKLNVGAVSPRPSLEYSIDFDNENDPGRLLVAFHDDLVELCHNKAVWEMLKRRKVRVENMSGFFLDLDDIDRITKPRYIPTDDDILKARLKTLGVSETICTVNSGTEKGYVWRICWYLDVGGARYQRAAWAPHFDDAPISAFDQVLTEDPTINRLEDSLAMWRDLCKNKILAGASIVLFLNKCDLLQTKLKAGVRLNQFLTSYGDRPNDYANVTKTLKSKFDRIRREHCPDAQIYTHFITATDTRTTSIAINAVRDKIMRENLQSIGFVH